MPNPIRPSCCRPRFLLLLLLPLAHLLAAPSAFAQQAGDTLVGLASGGVVVVDLTTGAQTPLAIPQTLSNGVIDLAEDSSGNLALSGVSGVSRADLPAGAMTNLLDSSEVGSVGAVAVAPTGDYLAAGIVAGNGTVYAVDSVTGDYTAIVDALPNTFVSQVSGVAVDAANNLTLGYLNAFDLSSNPPVVYSVIARVPAGSTTPSILVDSRDPGPMTGRSYAYMAYDGADTVAVSTLLDEIFLVDVNTGAASELTANGAISRVAGLSFAPNGDVLVLDQLSGIVRVAAGSGSQSVVPNSVVEDGSGIIVYTPEPGFALGLGVSLAVLCLLSERNGGRRAQRA